MPRPTTEQLKKWYASFTEQMRKQGCDLNTMYGRMSIVGIYEDKSKIAKNKDYEDNEFYAFAEVGNKGMYKDPYPHTDDYDRLKNDLLMTHATPNKLREEFQSLKASIKSSPNSKSIRKKAENIQKELDSYREKALAQYDELNNVYEPTFTWFKNNITGIDPESEVDLQRIEQLYNLAQDGKLLFMSNKTDPEASRQIYVNDKGECGLLFKRNLAKAFNSTDISKGLFTDPNVMVTKDDARTCAADPKVREIYKKEYGITLSAPVTEEELKEFRENIYAKNYPDVPKGQRCALADSFYATHTVQTFSIYNRDQKVDPYERYEFEKMSISQILTLEHDHPGFIPSEDITTDQVNQARAEAREAQITKFEDTFSSLTAEFNEIMAPIREMDSKETSAALAWYESFSEEAEKQGIDLNNPLELAKFNIYDEKGSSKDSLTHQPAFDKPIDPNDPEDAKRLNTLYEHAMKGLMSYSATDSPEDLRQISTTKEGKCAIGMPMKNVNKNPNPSWHELLDNNNSIYTENDYKRIFENEQMRGLYKAQFDKEIVDPVDMSTIPEIPKKPDRPPKPGVWSWVKRILTFGIVKKDFTDYETFDQRLADYRTEARRIDNLQHQARVQNQKAKNQWKDIANDFGALRHPENPEMGRELNNNLHAMANYMEKVEAAKPREKTQEEPEFAPQKEVREEVQKNREYIDNFIVNKHGSSCDFDFIAGTKSIGPDPLAKGSPALTGLDAVGLKDAPDSGLAIYTGIISQAGIDAFKELVIMGVAPDKSLAKVKERNFQWFKNLEAIGLEAVGNGAGGIDPDKYAAAMTDVIGKCTTQFFYDKTSNITPERIAMSSLATKLTDTLDSMGRGNLLSESVRKKVETIRPFPSLAHKRLENKKNPDAKVKTDSVKKDLSNDTVQKDKTDAKQVTQAAGI